MELECMKREMYIKILLGKEVCITKKIVVIYIKLKQEFKVILNSICIQYIHQIFLYSIIRNSCHSFLIQIPPYPNLGV